MNMRLILKNAITACVILYVCLTLYFIFCPFYEKSLETIFVPRLHSLTSARNYYTILSSVSTITTGFLGLLLGYLYFVKRNEYDARSSHANRTRDRIRFIIDDLNRYDELVSEILSCCCLTNSELQRTRSKIELVFDKIEALPENNETLLKLDLKEIKSILSVNSFVEQTSEIMQFDIELLKITDVSR